MREPEDLKQLKAEIAQLRQVLGTAICWIAQSAHSPLNLENAQELLKMLEDSEMAGKP